MLKLLRIIVAIAGVVALISLAGCGGSDSSSPSGASSTSNGEASGSGASKEFAGLPINDQIVDYGDEVGGGELEQAAEVAAKSMKAWGARDWEGLCETLAEPLVEEVEGEAGDCVAGLERDTKDLPAAAFKDNLKGSIVALREENDHGVALYHGRDGKDWALPMAKEGDEWKVASPVPLEFVR